MAFLTADVCPRASEHVPEMIALVRALSRLREAFAKAAARGTAGEDAAALRDKFRAAGYDFVDADEGTAAVRKTRGTKER